ncbi:MAG: aminodeoxychorismate/anthranilate synthase component II [Bdellovibrionales bacterium]
MLTIIDNYDSFTYNLVQYFGDLGHKLDVFRNDQITLEALLDKKPEAIIISPGPSDPDNAGICLDIVKAAVEHNTPLLGVCLGHQTIGQALGGKIIKTPPMHGKTSDIKHNNTSVFKGLESRLTVTRYHSLIIDPQTLPDELLVTAQTDDNIIMGIAHKTKPIHGVQFHPESVATHNGHAMLKNFLDTI